jgi:hypothetical protein
MQGIMLGITVRVPVILEDREITEIVKKTSVHSTVLYSMV